jgi:hypothetical protein
MADLLVWDAETANAYNTLAWVSQSINLSAYIGQDVRLRFYFDTMDSVLNYYEGYYVDDVQICGVN